MRTRILVVEDEAVVRESLLEQFSSHDGFESVGVGTGADALRAVADGGIDLVVMDVGLPDADGRDVVRAMRESQFLAPVIMLSGMATSDDVVRGLDAGAYDYVAKPFRFAELMARVRTHLRLWRNSGDSVSRVAGFEFRYGTRELVDAEGASTRLTEKEAGILRHLLNAAREPVSRDALLREVWGYRAAPDLDTHTLETHVYRLRRKLERDGSGYILTTPGGYRLVPDGVRDRDSARAA